MRGRGGGGGGGRRGGGGGGGAVHVRSSAANIQPTVYFRD